VFGGFASPKVAPDDAAYVMDAHVYPAQIRPLNKYVDAQAEGLSAQIDAYKCPSDRTHSTAIIGQPGELVEEESLSSWEANGSSFCLNTRFMQGYSWTSGGNFATLDTPELDARIANHLSGGSASRFIMWDEQGFYSATYRAGPTLSTSLALPQRQGWHH